MSVKVARAKAKLYKINVEHSLVKMLREYETKVSVEIAEREKTKIQKPVLA